jgi:predicted dehydrogenase
MFRWTAKAADAGKHVLCEKPLSMTVAEAKTLLDVRARTGVKICEAFMIRSAPQWLRVRQLLDEGRIGELRAVNAGVFSYFNINPANIRNQVETGGGAALRHWLLSACSRPATRFSARNRGAWWRLSIAMRRWGQIG